MAGTSPSEGTGEDLADTITIATSRPPSGYNGNTSTADPVLTASVENLTSSGFAAFAPGGHLEPNTDFGSYEKIGDDPLTVRYTIDDDAVWSDGVPIDYDDVLLAWAAMSGTHPAGGGTDLFRASSTDGFASLGMIEGEPGDKQFEAVFSKPYADWEALFTTGTILPAHIAAEQGGLPADDDGAALVAAIRNDDRDALTPVAEFWNTGWDYEADLPSLPDTDLLPTSGPYSYVRALDGALTLERNERYWGEDRRGRTDTIVLRTVADEDAVQALADGEVDVVEPADPTVDVRAALEQIGGTVTVDTGQSLTFSHVDLDQRPGAVFEDLRVRRAFAACMPRADLVDRFLSPVDPGGTVMNLREYQPAQEDYRTVLDAAPAAQGDGAADIERARALLREAGRTQPVRVSMMYPSASHLRADQVELVKESCDQAGFDVVAQPEADWSALLSRPGTWDAVVFGWAGSGLATPGRSIYVSGGERNYGGYGDAEVDRLWDEIAGSTDPEQVIDLKTALEQRLAETQYNVVLHASPTVTAYSSTLQGVEPNPTRTGITWNAYGWTKQN